MRDNAGLEIMNYGMGKKIERKNHWLEGLAVTLGIAIAVIIAK